jgi:glycosyltransferase involved in cell wall biosynthesis
MSTLTIISHTEHYKTIDGTIVGLGSTVTEVNHLTAIFDTIIHVAMLYDDVAPPSALPYNSNNIKFVSLPPLGGKRLVDKLKIVWRARSVVKIIANEINKTDYFQFRAPTGIGVFVIPYLVLFSSKKGWFKYAGNWKEHSPSLAYGFQRWFLKNQKRLVTINGIWHGQPAQCLSFENPCLTSEDINRGKDIVARKSMENKNLELCFVGRLEKEKGLDVFIDALLTLSAAEVSKIKTIHIVGFGKNLEYYIQRTRDSNLSFIFHGYLSRNDVHNIYRQCHGIVLPSASEGFPKVISEAMNYGCLPIVSNVSSISHYITDSNNGFLIENINLQQVLMAIRSILSITNEKYQSMISSQNNQLDKFTYEFYNERIKLDILKDN